jgi:asparagine synthase (glutamine-hydrolysing)
MCGIFGYAGDFPPDVLRDGLKAIAHRGPDDSGVFYDHKFGIGLGHVRLSIVDLSSLGHQPMLSDDGRVSLIFNGEIFNYQELRRELKEQGYSFKGNSDTEVLLNLYLRDGVELLNQLNGMFAFALWDRRNESLFVARDGLGIKPLYYTQTARGFSFGSELKSLFALPGLTKEIDIGAVHDYLSFLWAPAPQTMLKGVRKLEPGCALLIKRGRIEKEWRYYDIPATETILSLSDRDAIAAVRSTVRDAVHRQMVADVPVGAFLSGGLDSSSVVAFAREVSQGRRLQCFSIEMEAAHERREGMVSDLPYARQVAKHLDVDLHVVKVDSLVADDFVRMIYHLDEPLGDPAPLNVLFISKLARENGIKVLLSGAGGDDIFTGYRRHRALQLEHMWSGLPKTIRTGISSVANSLPTGLTALRRTRKALQFAHLEGDERLASYFQWLEPHWVERLLKPRFNAVQTENRLIGSLKDLPDSVPRLNRMLYLECRHFLADHNLNYTDKMSMAAGVEVRVPLLDPDLVRLAFRLPLDVKQRGSQGKWVLTEAMRGILPDSVLNRPKTGFGAPLRSWLAGPLRQLMNDTLSTESIRRRGIFDEQSVRELIRLNETGRIDASYPLFTLLSIELWCRIFIDNTITPTGL